ncbi:MAG: hypothetical protein LUC83_01735 [Clostridiales bacterium]|nr:hypothetical protein [Clostridiales bacterium]
MNQDPFKEYIRESEPDKRDKGYAWYTAFGLQTIFGRSDVQRELGLKSSRSSALLREMSEQGIIVPVSGHGKGKYRFSL